MNNKNINSTFTIDGNKNSDQTNTLYKKYFINEYSNNNINDKSLEENKNNIINGNADLFIDKLSDNQIKCRLEPFILQRYPCF